MRTTLLFTALAALYSQVAAHLVLTYPGTRGNNLHNYGNLPDGSIPEDGLGVGVDSTGNLTYPYGMQWIYPCGGMATSHNRTKWPLHGGAIAFQPGWFSGHQYAFLYVNMGAGTVPLNMSFPMVPVFQIVGPSNNAYPGSICLPQVYPPPQFQFKVGDNATIQVIMTAQHGAALYACADITFAEPEDVAEVNSTNCFNSSIGLNQGGPIGFNYVYTSVALTAGSAIIAISWTTLAILVTGSVISSLL